MPRVNRIVVLTVLALLASSSSHAAAKDIADPSNAALVKRLGEADFRARDEAAKALLARGEAAREALHVAARDTADPEVQARATALLVTLDATAKRKGLVLELKADATTVEQGQPINLRPVFRNTGKGSIVLLRPIDGSDVGWRVVHYGWVVTDAKGQPVKRVGMGRCGNVNPLTMEDRVTLKPGETYEPMGGDGSFMVGIGAYYQLTAGTYRVSFAYSFDPSTKDRGLKLGHDDVGVLDGVLEVAVESEPIRLTITRAGAARKQAQK